MLVIITKVKNLIFDNFYGFHNLALAKEAIEEAQTSAIALGSKRKAELDAKEAKKIQKKKNKKWYEASSDEEDAKEEIKVRPPSEIRNSQLRIVLILSHHPYIWSNI